MSNGLRSLAQRYRCLFVDVHGVLHDGAQAFPGAPGALREARRSGIFVAIMTNSPSRSDVVAGRLQRAGVESDCYDTIVTSGELTWRYLTDPATAATRPFFFGADIGPSWVRDMPNRAEDINAADVVVASAIAAHTEAEYHASDTASLLERALERGLPMLVADSDVTYPLRGSIRLGPGWLAQEYERRGGNTLAFGKPHSPIYAEGSRVAGNPRAAEVLMIGDNLLTDVLGASRNGHHSLLVLQHGVHRGVGVADLEREIRAVGARPTYVAESLYW